MKGIVFLHDFYEFVSFLRCYCSVSVKLRVVEGRRFSVQFRQVLRFVAFVSSDLQCKSNEKIKMKVVNVNAIHVEVVFFRSVVIISNF